MVIWTAVLMVALMGEKTVGEKVALTDQHLVASMDSTWVELMVSK